MLSYTQLTRNYMSALGSHCLGLGFNRGSDHDLKAGWVLLEGTGKILPGLQVLRARLWR